MEHFATALVERAPVLVPVLLILATAFLTTRFLNRGYAKLPLLGKEYGNSEQRRKAFIAGAAELYRRGYEKFRDEPFRLTTVDGERIVVPNSTLEELRRLPEGHINNRKMIEQAVEKSYTGIAGDSDLLNHVVRADLTRSLNRINPRLMQEVARAVDDELGQCKDWESTRIYQKLLRIVAIVSGHIFLGPELCRREEYLYASINYTVDLFAAVRKLKAWNSLVRPFVQYFVPELAKIAEHRKKAREFLLPVIRERRETMKNGGEVADDMLQWMINKADEFKVSDEELADTQLTLSLASIHTTTMTTTNTLYEMVDHPEVIEEVRNEIKQVLKEGNGVFTIRALFDLKLMDSVMRETQRVAPIRQTAFPRYVSKAVTLNNGIHIPAGSILETPHVPVLQDPTLYANPEKFDAHRFVDLRESKVPDLLHYKNREQYQFIAVTKENMSFGYGAHACPGRFFAANEIKLIIARMLLQYDMRAPKGTTMLPRIRSGGALQIDPRLQIEFRRIAAPEEASVR